MPGTIHVFAFVKGDETLRMAYTSEGVMNKDPMAPIYDGWAYITDFDIPEVDITYDEVKALWDKQPKAKPINCFSPVNEPCDCGSTCKGYGT